MNQSDTSPERADCARCRRWLLTTGPGPHALSGESARQQAHLQDCPACRAYADEILAWRRLGGRLRGEVTAPGAVRQRVFRELALARTQWLHDESRRRRRGWRAAALAGLTLLAVIAIAGAWLLPRGSAPAGADAASAVVEDHWRDIHHQHIDSADPAAVQRWLRARLPIPVDVTTLPGAALQGARLCWLRGRLGAVLRYRVGDAALAYYIMPAAAGGDTADRDRAAIEQESAQGYAVVMWHEHGLLHALVGNLPRTRLLVLAAACHRHDDVYLHRDS